MNSLIPSGAYVGKCSCGREIELHYSWTQCECGLYHMIYIDIIRDSRRMDRTEQTTGPDGGGGYTSLRKESTFVDK